MRFYIHELEIILKDIKSIYCKLGDENTKSIEINYLVSRYSLGEIVINAISVKLRRNGKVFPFVWYYPAHPLKDIFLKNKKSDDLYSLCKANELMPAGVVRYDELVFDIDYTDADKKENTAVISLQFDGDEWKEIYNNSPLRKNRRYATCNIELISDENTDISLTGISFNDNRFDYHICINNYSDKELRLWNSDWFLSCIKNGNITNYYRAEAQGNYHSIVNVPPHSIKETLFSIDNHPVEGCASGILTAIETDTQNSVGATVSFTVSYDLGGKEDIAVSDWIVARIGVVPEIPELCKEKFDYRHSPVSTQFDPLYPPINSLTYADFIVYSYNFRCAKRHNTESVTAFVPMVKKDGTIIQEKINAAFCKTCNKYYVLKNDYDTLKKIGTILCKQISEEVLLSSEANNPYNNLNPVSELRLLGYNVDAKEDLSEKQRQTILVYAIKSGIYSQERIISFITWLIERASKNVQMTNAVEKWKTDLQFIKNDCNTRRDVGVKSFYETTYKIKDDDLPF